MSGLIKRDLLYRRRHITGKVKVSLLCPDRCKSALDESDLNEVCYSFFSFLGDVGIVLTINIIQSVIKV